MIITCYFNRVRKSIEPNDISNTSIKENLSIKLLLIYFEIPLAILFLKYFWFSNEDLDSTPLPILKCVIIKIF